MGMKRGRWVQGTGTGRSNKPWWQNVGHKEEERGSDDAGFLAQVTCGVWSHLLRQRSQDRGNQ